ncbi:MAG TPA: putative maltokinase [Terriglobia bacterium]|nr:putative maltokinase [Terriglobia bacterium]
MPEPLTLDFAEGWHSLERGETRRQFEEVVLPAYLSKQRWFASKSTEIKRAELRCRFVFPGASGEWLLATFRAHLADGRSEDYFVPLATAWNEQPDGPPPACPAEAIALISKGNQTGFLREALTDARFIAGLVRAVGDGKEMTGPDRRLHFRHTGAYFQLQEEDEQNIRKLGAEQSNSSILIANRMILKAYRKLERGIQPELEMGRYLTDVAGYRNTPPFLGSIELFDHDGQPTALAVIQGFVPNQGDGWSFTLRHLRRFFNGILQGTRDDAGNDAYYTLLERLGIRIGELHRAFAIESGDPAFQPEAVTAADVDAWKQQILSEAESTFGLLSNSERMLPPEQQTRVRRLLEQQHRIQGLIKDFRLDPGSSLQKTRFHGDLHLGQVLVAENDFYIIDFEGEPARPFAQRRARHSPLKDVAGMLRSLNYAAWSALFEAGAADPEKIAALERPAIEWERAASNALMQGYRKTIEGCPSCPSDPDTFRRLLDLFILEKALYEIRYELANRPSWLGIPVEGVMSLLAHLPGE